MYTYSCTRALYQYLRRYESTFVSYHISYVYVYMYYLRTSESTSRRYGSRYCTCRASPTFEGTKVPSKVRRYLLNYVTPVLYMEITFVSYDIKVPSCVIIKPLSILAQLHASCIIYACLYTIYLFLLCTYVFETVSLFQIIIRGIILVRRAIIGPEQ